MSRRRIPHFFLALVLVTAVTALALPASAAPILPGQDPFYAYSGAKPLAQIARGTVLKKRTVQVALGTTSTPMTAEQLLYRTAGELGEPTVTVTTVLLPATGTLLPRIVDYLSFYDALGAQCDPSYTLAGGDPGAENRQLAQEEEVIILSYLNNGFIVTIPDFEGTNLEWTAGHEAGYNALDALRATESYLGLTASTKAALTGYSGGSIAAQWGGELAPAYAPELNIVGVAAGGIPVHFAHNLTYVNGSAGWSGVIPAVLVALARAYRIDLSPYLSPYGVQLTTKVAHACIGAFNGAYPGLTVQKLLKPQYQDFLAIPAFAHVVNSLIMGSVPGHPKAPLFLAVGNSDGTGDGIMVAGDVEGLAHEYCTQGVPLQFTMYNGSDHTQAAVQFEPTAIQFLHARFAGLPFTGNCASVGIGNSLAPLPIRAASTPTTGGTTETSPAASADRGDLATTGLHDAIPAAALVLAVGALVAASLRRQRFRGNA